ncbi:hypothetical protein E5288_WYG000086 [Bos mutus]|uniref:Uncharacterized protein n=1 Tax=Bos mutus TaxID=72004 RepID=A0A6B0RJG5_9CETA|nr:hypothetical protein [Bos mutus]
MTHRSPSSFPTIRLMKLQVGNKMIKGKRFLVTCYVSVTPLQKSRTQNGNAEFQVKMGHQQPGAPSNAAMLAASVMARSTSPKKICLGPLEGFLKKRRQVSGEERTPGILLLIAGLKF